MANGINFGLLRSGPPRIGGLFGGEPEPEQMQPNAGLLAQQAPQGRRDWGEAAQVIGAGLRDIGNPGGQNLAALQQSMASAQGQRAQEALKVQEIAERSARARALGLTGREADLYINSPEDYGHLMRRNLGTEYRSEGDQVLRVGPDGAEEIFRRDPTFSELETGRHNLATEGLTGRGQDLTYDSTLRGQNVTMRGQDLTAQTAAQRLAHDSLSAQDRQVAALIQRGVDPARAEDLVYGREDVRTDPVTGNQYVVNAVDGSARMLDYAEDASMQPAGLAPPERTLWDNTAGVAGLSGAATDAYARFAGQIPGWNIGEGAEQVVANRQLFQNASNDLIRALSINPRFPVAEIERIEREINIKPNSWDSPRALQVRMREVDGYLHGRLNNLEEAQRNRGLPASARAEAAQSAEAIRNFLNVLGVPQGGGAVSEDDEALIRRYLEGQ